MSQTTIVTSKSGEQSLITSHCPKKPTDCSYMTTKDGEIDWYNDKVIKVCNNGTRIVWFNKPTLADAVKRNPEYTCAYYRFYSDGSVEATYDNKLTLYWSSSDSSESSVFCSQCETECGDNIFKKWGFCTSRCMVSWSEDCEDEYWYSQ